MRVLIAAGGTAGHINPALAIAGAIKKADPSAEIHFAGRKEGMEYRLVTQAGYPFHHIEITGFQRRLSLNNIKRNIITLWNLALSGPKARAMMKEVQPDLVIGCGGYVSGPVVRCAAKKGIKTAIHEQNAFPGVTNKLLAPDVDIVFAAVPAAVEKLGAPEKTQVVGNPVRPEVFEKAGERDAIRAQLGAGDRTVILSFGGSLGARRVNEVVADLCAWEQKEHKPVLHIHATGQYGVKLFQDLEKEKGFAPGESLVVKEYINNMPDLLAAAEAAGVELASCSCSDKCAAGAVNTDCAVCAVNMTECAGVEQKPEPEPEPVAEPDAEPETEKGNAGMLLLVLAVAVLGGGAAFYFKVYRPKQQAATEPEEDYGEELEDYDGEEDGPPWDEDEDENEDTEDGE